MVGSGGGSKCKGFSCRSGYILSIASTLDSLGGLWPLPWRQVGPFIWWTRPSALALASVSFSGLVPSVAWAPLVGGLILGFALGPLFDSLVLVFVHDNQQTITTINLTSFHGLVLGIASASSVGRLFLRTALAHLIGGRLQWEKRQ